MKDCGLDEPELSVEVSYTKEEEDQEEITGTFTLHVSRDPDEKAAAGNEEAEGEDEEETEEEEITAYARVGESRILYKISSEDYKKIMDASFDSLRHSRMFTGDFADVTQIEIALEDTTYTLTSEEKDGKRIFYYQGEEIESLELQRALEGLHADSFTKEQPKEAKEIGLTLYLDNENFPKTEIELYRYDGKYCLAVVDKKPVSLVERSLAVDLMEAVYGIVL